MEALNIRIMYTKFSQNCQTRYRNVTLVEHVLDVSNCFVTHIWIQLLQSRPTTNLYNYQSPCPKHLAYQLFSKLTYCFSEEILIIELWPMVHLCSITREKIPLPIFTTKKLPIKLLSHAYQVWSKLIKKIAN